MADPITREQVERALEAAQECNMYGINAALGSGWAVRADIPADVRAGWTVIGYNDLTAALTRWRDELAAAEPVRRVARWDASHVAYALTPPYETEPRDIGRGDHTNGRIVATPDREKAIAWGYEIEGGPEPIDDSSPERLRERRERIPWTLQEAAAAVRAVLGDERERATGSRFLALSVEALESGTFVGDGLEECTRAYAAALSAEEERLAANRQEAEAHYVARQTPEPERPAPRFKVGDWVRRQSHAGCTEPFRIAKVTPIAVDPPGTAHATYCYAAEGSHAPTLERALEPASPPAPEVVDVPQPVVVVKRCGDTSAMWHEHDNHVDVDREGVNVPTPVALILAMADAIRAQQGGAS